MNTDWDEKEIKELFHELRRAEERRVPSFTSVCAAALARTGKARPRQRLLRVAAATIGLILLGVFVAIFFSPPAKRAAPTQTPESAASITESPSSLLLSQWRPPTDFLLKSPGELLLKTVPQLGESLMEIKAIMPDQKN